MLTAKLRCGLIDAPSYNTTPPLFPRTSATQLERVGNSSHTLPSPNATAALREIATIITPRQSVDGITIATSSLIHRSPSVTAG